ncbi:toxin glutamine deamidase domain-containing protein [Streptomyces rimosus]|uniref:toxin glutamine deamidase domain-containing protein n=1 Tax=Streptomyces rimosus TaxID=1927 RepID=UPI000D15EA7A|nr:toxin glutamine deamidase domain-containing protein [Streptomyces rimosus]
MPPHEHVPAQETTSPPENGHSDPNPNSLNAIRDDLNQESGGLLPPDPSDQQLLEDAHPRNADGTPQRFADPFDPWGQLQNDGGDTVPGRGNNCADCSRSFLETWYGNPQVSAPRTLDTDEHGNSLDWKPEDNANENQIRWSGATHTYAGRGDDPNTAARIAHDLRQAGHGAAAIVQVNWPNNGGGHAFNAVNHHGRIIWVDAQSGAVSTDPLHIPNAEHAYYIPLDANRQPLHADHVVEKQDDASTEKPENRSDTTEQTENKPDTNAEQTDADSDGSSTDKATDHPDQTSTGHDGTAESRHTTADGNAPTSWSSDRESGPSHRGADVSQHLAEALRNDPNPMMYGKPTIESPHGGTAVQAPHSADPHPQGPAEPAGADHGPSNPMDGATPPTAPSGDEPAPSDDDHDHDSQSHDQHHVDNDNDRSEEQDPAERFKAPSAGDVRVDPPPEFPDPEDPGETPDTSDLDAGVDDKSRGGLVEQLDLDDTDRVTVDENGLITSIDGKTVKEYLQEMSEERARRHALMREDDQEGPCSALAIDRRTGMITEGLNGLASDLIDIENLHPLLRENYLGMAAWVHPVMAAENVVRMGDRLGPNGKAERDENGNVIKEEMALIGKSFFDEPLRHAEVKAVNELLWARQRQMEMAWKEEHGENSTPPPLSRDTLSEIRFDPRWIEESYSKNKKNKGAVVHLPGQSAPACPNCHGLLRDVPSYAGRHQYTIGDYRRRGSELPPEMD